MKHGKIPVIFTVFLAALIVLEGCSGGSSSPSGSNNVVDDPTNGVMSRATAEEIFAVENVNGGVAIAGFKSTNALTAWLLRSGSASVSRAVINVTVPETFTIPANIENLQVVKIEDRAFKPETTGDTTDISTIISVVTLPDTITSLGENLFEGIQKTSITLEVPPTVVERISEAVVVAAAGTKALPKELPAVAGDPPRVITPEPESLQVFARSAANAAFYTLSYYDTTGKAKLNGEWYQIPDTESDLRNLFNAIYEPNKPESSIDSVETGKTTIKYTEAISAATLGLFKITIGASAANDRVELRGTELPTHPDAEPGKIIVIDIGLPGTTSSGLPTFYIPNGGLGDPNIVGDYSHIRLRVNNGAELVILADNSGYLIAVGNSCPEGYFKGGCVEVMAGGKLRDGAFEGFPLGTGAVIVNRAGSYLSIGPEENSADALASSGYNLWYKGYLLGPSGNDARVEWDNATATNYLEVRSKQIATNAQLTVKKAMGLIYSVWFVGDAKLTIDIGSSGGLLANERGIEDYNFYSTSAKSDLILVKQGSYLDGRFLVEGAKTDSEAASLAVSASSNDITKPGQNTGTAVSYGSGTGIVGYLVTP